jgi:two-component system response regulator HydG
MSEQTEKLSILVLEDDEIDRIQVQRLLAKSSLSEYEIEYVKLLSEAIDLLKQNSYQVILSDLNVSDSAGIETLTKMNKICPDAAIIAVTGQSDKETGRFIHQEIL